MARSGVMSEPWSGHAPGDRDYRRLLVGLFFAGIATFAQLYATQAVLPLIVVDFDIDPATAALTVSASTFGLAAAVVPWSLVADRIGRVPAMAIGVIAATVLGLLAPLSPEVTTLFVVRFLEGAALGAVPAVALAFLSEEVAGRHVASAAGSYIAGTTVGGLTGRLVSGPVGDVWGWHVGMWAVAGVAAVSAALFLLLIPPARGFVPHHRRGTTGPSVASRLLANLRSGRQLAICAQGFLLMGAFVATYNYLGFLLTGPLGLSAGLASSVFLAYLAGTVSSPYAGVLASRRGRFPILIVSIVIMAGGMILTLVPHIAAVIVALLVFTAGFFAAHAVASGWAPAAAAPEARAQASSLYYLGYYGGSSLFGWCLGFVYVAWGWHGMVITVVGMCAVSAAIAWAGLGRRAAAGTA